MRARPYALPIGGEAILSPPCEAYKGDMEREPSPPLSQKERRSFLKSSIPWENGDAVKIPRKRLPSIKFEELPF